MRIFCWLSLVSLATAAIIPFNGLRQQSDGAELQMDAFRLMHRQRRDVSEIENEYLPPGEETETEEVSEDKLVEEPQDTALFGDNGYEYKTVRRLKYRQRRDVSEIANKYLPPAEKTASEEVSEVKSEEQPEDSSNFDDIASPPAEQTATENVAEIKSEEDPEDSAILGENGYEYKTVRRLKYRQRRDVSEIANEYLPPSEESATEEISEVKPVEEPQDTALLGDNGYEYKTVRRLKYRQRRDVSEIDSKYLPPAQETATEDVSEVKSKEQLEESGILGDTGSPPAEETAAETIVETKSEEEPQDSAVFGENGYEYKTVRRLKYRQRRDVSKIASEYLPPAKENAAEEVSEVKSEEQPEDSANSGDSGSHAAKETADEPQDSALLGDNGYEYKIVRRLKYRQRRDVSEIANKYLPPSGESATEEISEVKSEEQPEDSASLGDSGSPPAEETAEETVIKSEEEPQDSAVFGENGYEYKTVRRLKYRQRRDVSEIANKYLPPSEESATEEISEVKSEEQPEDSANLDDSGSPPAEETAGETGVKSEEEPQDSAVFGENGYEYKTVRRLKYRQRRDVSEIANKYLPPSEESATEEISEVKSEEQPEDSANLDDSGSPPADGTVGETVIKSEDEPQDSAVFGENGYEYKTVRRLKYRRRRDVSEIANKYLPPAEEIAAEEVSGVKSEEQQEQSSILSDSDLSPSEETAAEEVAETTFADEPQNTAVLGDSGYEYKTVRRLKYRQRRDVSEIAHEYLPPAEETVTQEVSEVKSEEKPVDSANLGDSGYPPTEETAGDAIAEIKSEEEPQDTAILGDSGYEYKTVHRLKYRKRRDISDLASE